MSRPDFDPSGTLRVLGYDYEVRTVAGADADRHNIDGFHHMASGTIEVREDMIADRMAETTLHEITHAVSDGLNAEMSEEQVHVLARGLYAVCRDNPLYMKRLLFG